MRAPRFELGTSALSGPRSNQLSYARDAGRNFGERLNGDTSLQQERAIVNH
jgi:hypothetical protein